MCWPMCLFRFADVSLAFSINSGAWWHEVIIGDYRWSTGRCFFFSWENHGRFQLWEAVDSGVQSNCVVESIEQSNEMDIFGTCNHDHHKKSLQFSNKILQGVRDSLSDWICTTLWRLKTSQTKKTFYSSLFRGRVTGHSSTQSRAGCTLALLCTTVQWEPRPQQCLEPRGKRLQEKSGKTGGWKPGVQILWKLQVRVQIGEKKKSFLCPKRGWIQWSFLLRIQGATGS